MNTMRLYLKNYFSEVDFIHQQLLVFHVPLARIRQRKKGRVSVPVQNETA